MIIMLFVFGQQGRGLREEQQGGRRGRVKLKLLEVYHVGY